MVADFAIDNLELTTSLLFTYLSSWPHPAGTYVSTTLICSLSYLLLSARLRPEPESSPFVHLLSGTNFPCVFALLNP